MALLKLFNKRVEWKPAPGVFEPVARSAFRTLGLRATAAQAEVFDAASGVRLALKLGVRKTFAGDMDWLGQPERGEGEVRDAVGRLSEPAQRARERLFWFHGAAPAAAVEDVAGLMRAVEAALAAGGEAEGAPGVEGGRGDGGGGGGGGKGGGGEVSHAPPRDAGAAHAPPRDTGASPAALHDAALLAVAGLVRLDPGLSEGAAWARAFDLWRRLYECEEFWSLLVASDLKGGYEQAVTFREVAELRRSAPRLVSAHAAERAQRAAAGDDARAASRVLRVLRGAGLPRPLLEEYEREATGPFEDALVDKLDAAFAWVELISVGEDARRRNYYNGAWRRFDELRPRLADFAALAGADSYPSRRVFEHAAAKLLRLAERFESVGRREESLFVCLKARALAPPDSAELAAAEERLRESGAADGLEALAPERYAEALARELAEERVPRKLFEDDPKGGQTLDSIGGADDRGGCLTSALVWAAMVAACFGLQWCGVINTRRTSRTPIESLPRMTFTPPPVNLNFNLNDYKVPPLILPPSLVEPRPATKQRGRRRTKRLEPPPTGTEMAPSPPPRKTTTGGPANVNATPPRR